MAVVDIVSFLATVDDERDEPFRTACLGILQGNDIVSMAQLRRAKFQNIAWPQVVFPLFSVGVPACMCCLQGTSAGRREFIEAAFDKLAVEDGDGGVVASSDAYMSVDDASNAEMQAAFARLLGGGKKVVVSVDMDKLLHDAGLKVRTFVRADNMRLLVLMFM